MAHAYTAEFRIYSETLAPSIITKELGLEPCQYSPGPGLWAYNGGKAEGFEWNDLEEGLRLILSHLAPHRAKMIQYGSDEKTHYIWWCGHFQDSFDGGPKFSPALLKELGEFGAELYIDNYFSG